MKISWPRRKLWILWTTIGILAVAFSTFGALWLFHDKASAPFEATIQTSELRKLTTAANKNTAAAFNKTKFSLTDPTSQWVIVNKSHHIDPISYEPADLVRTNGALIRQIAEYDFSALMAKAAADHLSLTTVSSFRSYDTQVSLYSNYVATYGQASADTFSARPGYSEHQTGLAIDFGSGDQAGCNLSDCFWTTKEGYWLKLNAPDFGFILRYPADKTTITGYKSEPWHYRYVGRTLAKEMSIENVSTLEQFFAVSGGTIYK